MEIVRESPLPSVGTTRTAFIAPVFGSPSTSSHVTFVRISMSGCAFTRSCIVIDARIELRTSRYTLLAYLVRYSASSSAVSPPPTTATGLRLKIGLAPSQMAHALIPRLQKVCSEGRPSLLAVAPVATITAFASTSVSVPVILNGGVPPLRSMLTTSSVRRSAPHLSAWFRIRSMRSGPVIPSGNPGKFSTSVVVMSCPPGTPPAETPSNMSGLNDALLA
mmetsp:Transcript_9820/g.24861  ORF Transcript_9820/g.24861 Transcript_9820/m.24861 type:complete len:220 (+) Transcript_9820:913-1572(+)